MVKAGLKAPPEGRTLESLCIVDVCKPGYDPLAINSEPDPAPAPPPSLSRNQPSPTASE